MIILIISAIATILGLAYFVFAKIAQDRYLTWSSRANTAGSKSHTERYSSVDYCAAKRNRWGKISDVIDLDPDDSKLSTCMQILLVLGVFCLVLGSLLGAFEYTERNYERTVAKYEIQYAAYTCALEQASESATVPTELYEDIIEYNKAVLRYKSNAENPWLNNLYSKRIADELQYIRVDIGSYAALLLGQ